MKRGKPPERRTPLARSTTPIKRSTKPIKRSRLRPISSRRRQVNAERAGLMEAWFGPREGWRCWFTLHPVVAAGGCYGPCSGHERLKRSRAGSTDVNLLDMEHIVVLCARHQVWVEDSPKLAHALGLADHSWER